MQRKRKKKQSKVSGSLIKWIFVLLVLLTSFHYLWKFLLKAPYLILDEGKVSVSGNDMVSENTVLNTLDLRPGQNLLSLDTEELENKLSALDRIESVDIKRDFPDALSVSVKEVTPAGYYIQDKKRYVVTSAGEVFPGLEGPGIEFRNISKQDMIDLSALLDKIKKTDKAYYDKILAVEFNYKKEVYVYKEDYYVKWQMQENITPDVIEKNIYLESKQIKKYNSKDKKITYIDFRLVEYSEDGIKGALIIK